MGHTTKRKKNQLVDTADHDLPAINVVLRVDPIEVFVVQVLFSHDSQVETHENQNEEQKEEIHHFGWNCSRGIGVEEEELQIALVKDVSEALEFLIVDQRLQNGDGDWENEHQDDQRRSQNLPIKPRTRLPFVNEAASRHDHRLLS